MKDSKKHGVGGVRLPLEAPKGGFGKKGSATAPQETSASAHPHASLRNRGQGHGSDKGTPKLPPSALEEIAASSVTRASGDDGQTHFVWIHGGRSVVIPMSVAISGGEDFIQRLGTLDIAILSPAARLAARDRLESAPVDTDVYVVTRSGYEQVDHPRFYIFGDGTIIKNSSRLRIFYEGKLDRRFASQGKLRIYEEQISATIRDQSVPMLLFFYALAPVLQPFLRQFDFLVQNTILEPSGSTSRYKSSLTNFLAGSVWGMSSSDLGYADNWNNTVTKIEEIFSHQNNGLVVLDEATSATGNAKARGDIISEVVHRLAGGVSRGRYQQDSRPFKLMVLSSSNESLTAIVSASSSVAQALEVRLIRLDLPDRNTGLFDTVPAGFQTIDDAMNQIFATVRQHHGLVAKRFVKEILAWSHRDHAEFLRALEESVKKFISGVRLDLPNSDPVEMRRVKPFALVFAAAELAFKTKTLKRKHWGKFRQTLRRAWKKYGRRVVPLSGEARLAQFLNDDSKILVDLTDGTKPELDDGEFTTADGFLYKDKKGELHLALTPEKMAKHLALRRRDLQKMRDLNALRGGKHLEFRVRLRLKNGEPKKESFYVFPIKSKPSHVISPNAISR